MFLIRATFWVCVIVLLLPADERQQARLYDSAAAAVARVTTFCDRNPKFCAYGAELWAGFIKKAEFGARLAFDLVSGSGHREEGTPAGVEPTHARGAKQPPNGPVRGTLTPSDLTPAWRGQVTATRS
jgi:hypothetical protein